MYPAKIPLTWEFARDPRSDLSFSSSNRMMVRPGLARLHVQPCPRRNSVSIVMLSGE